MPVDENLAIVAIFGIVGVVGLIGLFMYMNSRANQPGAGSGVMIVNPTTQGGWIIIKANSLEQAGFTQVTTTG